jgi:uncharacterized protein
MNAPAREARAAKKLSIVDCDIHPAFRSPSDLFPFLSERWRQHVSTFGEHIRQGIIGQLPHPRMVAYGMRVDALPEDGAPAGSDLGLMQRQHLDTNGVEVGMLISLGRGGMEERNPDFAQALSHAVNEWQLESWVKKEPRLRAGIVVPQEDPEFAVSEIERRADDPRFVQVIMSPRANEPIGHRRYWPIYAAAEQAGKPIGLHTAGYSGGHASTGIGWPNFYIEEHFANATSLQGVMTSLVFEGVFERFPKLKIALIEGGFAWVPAHCWRMDKHWERMREEVPHVKRKPSEYVREHFWYTTQPIEEPEKPEHLTEIIEWIGWDRLMFSTDYPHWDFDDPRFAFKIALSEEQKNKVFRENAKTVYGIK